ncbi:hypothetical protein [Bartonella grahamii]|uniref:Uncharacterized protein n=1 Tax=Bartonella grahamii TaxID=33045 RepID=A0A336NCP0_BARGR|nr:hypothetical protein [Bartonella grahamii]SSZ39419.1 Uncharacterised protein [Bartonella grahamii]
MFYCGDHDARYVFLLGGAWGGELGGIEEIGERGNYQWLGVIRKACWKMEGDV